jgi:hypothetical protein
MSFKKLNVAMRVGLDKPAACRRSLIRDSYGLSSLSQAERGKRERGKQG